MSSGENLRGAVSIDPYLHHLRVWDVKTNYCGAQLIQHCLKGLNPISQVRIPACRNPPQIAPDPGRRLLEYLWPKKLLHLSLLLLLRFGGLSGIALERV